MSISNRKSLASHHSRRTSKSPSKATNKGKDKSNKVHRKGRNEYHCLDDVCILVRVPSSSTYISRLSDMAPNDTRVSDASLEAYAKKVEESANEFEKGTSSSGSEGAASENYYEQYNFFNEEKTEKESEEGSRSSTDLSFAAVDCSEFLDPVSFAKELVKNVISESEANVETKAPSVSPEERKESSEEFRFEMEGFKESADYGYIDTKRSFSAWPTIESFDIELGAYKIDEYLSSFDTEEDWMYVIYYQGVQETLCSDLYKYQAIFSLPTWKYPIAQATASMYFTIEVCKVKPAHCSVDVSYRYETFSQARKPGFLDFQEKWLHFILDSKIKLFKTILY